MSIKYTDTAIGFREVPNETSLLINISNCPHHCKGCHSEYLRQDIGEELSPARLSELLNKCKGEITCVCFLGEGNDLDALSKLVETCYNEDVMSCLYTGCIDPKPFIEKMPTLDFIKTGPYIPERGGLDSETTNQRFYEIIHEGDTNGEEWYLLNDLTHLFWHKTNK